MEPNVLAVMLTRDRPELARRAIECFKAQTYRKARLLILDTGETPLEAGIYRFPEAFRFYAPESRGCSIGTLRNLANDWGCGFGAEVFVHWDDDDWSGPDRLWQQVFDLVATEADVVGYNEMLFTRGGEAWLFTSKRKHYALGTSLCYWRTAWERKPFPDLPKPGEMKGEDTRWLDGLRVDAESSHCCPGSWMQPRMIARIHGGNTMPYDIEQQIERGATEWRRVPEWDQRVNQILEGK